MKHCLSCYRVLPEGVEHYHPACARKFFGGPYDYLLEISLSDIETLARAEINERIAVTGVQKKLSTEIRKAAGTNRMTLVESGGKFILKPPSDNYPFIVEYEDLTMHLAEIADLAVAPHTLAYLNSGERVYLTKRMDRKGRRKIAMEDFCQLSGKMTEQKYQGSHEQLGKIVSTYSRDIGFDLQRLLELTLFCFLTGNNDMHLKNFSLIEKSGGFNLSPAYDLLPVTLLNPGDADETALTINGKKRKLALKDFRALAENYGIENRLLVLFLERLGEKLPEMFSFIEGDPFLPDEEREKYSELVAKRAKVLGIVF